MKTLFLGSFNAERHWRDEQAARLPELHDAGAAAVVSAMDELLFPLCARGDVLLTRRALDARFRAYLEEVGFRFSCNAADLEDGAPEADAAAEPRCVFSLLEARLEDPGFRPLLEGAGAVSPYAILSGTARLLDRLRLAGAHPAVEIVRRVNSKEYSHALLDRIGVPRRGELIRSSAELPGAVERWDAGRGVLLKDPFGVSGKGNLLLTSPAVQRRLQKHLAAQEQRGLAVRFLVEPCLDKVYDFSCQLLVAPDGSWEVTSVQHINNHQFTYLGSETAGPELTGFLDARGYFEVMARVAAALHQDGYFGEVCVDSMILRDDQIVPVVEINARKSMGLINQHLDAFLSRHAVQGAFLFFPLSHRGQVDFSGLLGALAAEGLLFGARRRSGILPMSCRALSPRGDQAASAGPIQGRLYFSSVGTSQEARREHVVRAKALLERLGFVIHFRS